MVVCKEKRFVVLLILLVFLSISGLFAQSSYRFVDLEQKVLAEHKRVLAGVHRVNAAQNQAAVSRYRYLPELITIYRYTPDGITLIEDEIDANQYLSIRLSQDIFELLKVRNSLRIPAF